MQTILLLALAGGALLLLAAVTHFSGQGSLNNIKSKTDALPMPRQSCGGL